MESITKPIPYIIKEEDVYTVVFVEPGTTLSTYNFRNERDAKICANEVKPLVMEALKAGLIKSDMVSNEEFPVEDLITEIVDSYGFKTVITERYKGETTVETFDKDGNKVTEEQKQEMINAIEEEKVELELKNQQNIEELQV